MGGVCSAYGVEERRIQYFVGNYEGKTSLGRPRCKWEDNIKKDLQNGGLWGMDLTDVFVNNCMSELRPCGASDYQSGSD